MIFIINGHHFRQRQRVIELLGVSRVSLWERGNDPETIYIYICVCVCVCVSDFKNFVIKIAELTSSKVTGRINSN